MSGLEAARAAMAAAPQDGALQQAYYGALAQSELFVLLEAEPAGETIAPLILQTSEARLALAFDSEGALAEFVTVPTPYLALSGRKIAAMLAGQNIGLAINPGDAERATVLPPEALAWIGDMAAPVGIVDEVPQELTHPGDLPQSLLTALDARLAMMAGLASAAYLAGVTFAGGAHSHLLVLVDVPPGVEADCASAIAEALRYSGLEAGTLDVSFTTARDPLVARLARVALRFDLPEVAAPETPRPMPPGSDPSKPPKLR